MSYNDSRSEGTRAAVKAMTDMNAKCPLTSYGMVGFSQGAVIAGDIASDVGNGRGPVDDDLVLGVTLIADGRRQQGVGQDIGPNPPGEGAEPSLDLGEILPVGADQHRDRAVVIEIDDDLRLGRNLHVAVKFAAGSKRRRIRCAFWQGFRLQWSFGKAQAELPKSERRGRQKG